MLSIPLITQDEAIGTINIYTKKTKKYSKDEIDLLKGLANQAALSIRNCELYDNLNKEMDVLSNILETSQSINAQLNLDNLLKITFEKTIELTKADSGILLLLKDYFLTIPFFRLAIIFSISAGLTLSCLVCGFTSLLSCALSSIAATKLGTSFFFGAFIREDRIQ